MSHSEGAVRFEKDGLILWFEYNGTDGIAMNPLFVAREEINDHWRHDPHEQIDDGEYCDCRTPQHTRCRCDWDPEPVEILTDYGSGKHWPGLACRRCKVIVKGLEPWGPDRREDPPEGSFGYGYGCASTPEWTPEYGQPEWSPFAKRAKAQR